MSNLTQGFLISFYLLHIKYLKILYQPCESDHYPHFIGYKIEAQSLRGGSELVIIAFSNECYHRRKPCVL